MKWLRQLVIPHTQPALRALLCYAFASDPAVRRAGSQARRVGLLRITFRSVVGMRGRQLVRSRALPNEHHVAQLRKFCPAFNHRPYLNRIAVGNLTGEVAPSHNFPGICFRSVFFFVFCSVANMNQFSSFTFREPRARGLRQRESTRADSGHSGSGGPADRGPRTLE